MGGPKLLQPQELQVWYVLPALRSELTIAMKELGLEQKKIAALLGVTTSAVSQYVKKKRAAHDVHFDDVLLHEIKESAKKIIEQPSTVLEQMQHLLKRSLESGVVCGLCKEHSCVEENCEVCK